jgi:hypothetical protein
VVANALAAVAACRAVGMSVKDIRRALVTFTAESNPGRGHVYLASGGPVIVDYGHNAAALDATGRMISDVWGGNPTAAVTLPGDHRDDLIIRTAEVIAAWFGRVIVYEDADRRGRAPGEMTNMITTAMRRARPDISCAAADGPREALRTAVADAAGQPVLFLHEKLTLAREALDAIGARPWPAAPADSLASPDGPGRPVVSAESPTRVEGSAARPAPTTSGDGPDVGSGIAATAAQAEASAAIPAPPVRSPVTAAAEQLLSPLTAAAEQVVPPLTAAAERVAPPTALVDRSISAAGALRRADAPTQWNRGHR